MTKSHILAAVLLLAGCADFTPPPPAPWDVPIPAGPRTLNRRDAEAACHGRVVEWNTTEAFQPWPRQITWRSTYRCESDGRLVGPFVHIEAL